MSTALATRPDGDIIEAVIAKGDLSKLSSGERAMYYTAVCRSVGLNPLTKPFDYINLNGKLTLYAQKTATDQLRKINGVSLGKPAIEYIDDLVVVTIDAVDKDGRKDCDVGAVTISNLRGDAKANAIMKAITKAKRRVTLSISGLGWLDESEVDSVSAARHVAVNTDTGEIIEAPQTSPRIARDPDPDPEEESDAATWQTWNHPTQAIEWAVAQGLDIEEARAILTGIKNEEFGGKLNASNMQQVFEQFSRYVVAQVDYDEVAVTA